MTAALRRAALRLHRDEGGQMMVFLIVGALLLVGFTWMVISTGQRVLSRQLLQNAVDAGAFGDAVVKAKGLNLIAFINNVMAALIAILIALQLIADGVLIVGALFTAACCAASVATLGTACASFCIPTIFQPSQTFSTTVRNVREAMETPVMIAERALMTVQDAIKVAAPVWASVEAYEAARENARDVTTVVWPLYEPLPVERDTWDTLCDHAVELALEPIGELVILPIPGFTDAVEGVSADLLDAFKVWYCRGASGGGGPARPPSRAVTMEQWVSGCEACMNPAPAVTDCSIPRRVETVWTTQRWTRNGEVRTPGPLEGATWEGAGLPCGGACARDPFCEGPWSEPDESGAREQLWWVELVGCRVECTRSVGAGESIADSFGGDRPRPMKMRESAGDHWARQAHNQARAFSFNEDDPERRRGAVGIARWGEERPPSMSLDLLLGLAQAEFYSRSAGLWEMDWKARLRRFYLPSGGLSVSTASTGGFAVPGADGLGMAAEALGASGLLGGGGDLEWLERFLVH